MVKCQSIAILIFAALIASSCGKLVLPGKNPKKASYYSIDRPNDDDIIRDQDYNLTTQVEDDEEFQRLSENVLVKSGYSLYSTQTTTLDQVGYSKKHELYMETRLSGDADADADADANEDSIQNKIYVSITGIPNRENGQKCFVSYVGHLFDSAGAGKQFEYRYDRVYQVKKIASLSSSGDDFCSAFGQPKFFGVTHSDSRMRLSEITPNETNHSFLQLIVRGIGDDVELKPLVPPSFDFKNGVALTTLSSNLVYVVGNRLKKSSQDSNISGYIYDRQQDVWLEQSKLPFLAGEVFVRNIEVSGEHFLLSDKSVYRFNEELESWEKIADVPRQLGLFFSNQSLDRRELDLVGSPSGQRVTISLTDGGQINLFTLVQNSSAEWEWLQQPSHNLGNELQIFKWFYLNEKALVFWSKGREFFVLADDKLHRKIHNETRIRDVFPYAGKIVVLRGYDSDLVSLYSLENDSWQRDQPLTVDLPNFNSQSPGVIGSHSGVYTTEHLRIYWGSVEGQDDTLLVQPSGYVLDLRTLTAHKLVTPGSSKWQGSAARAHASLIKVGKSLIALGGCEEVDPFGAKCKNQLATGFAFDLNL